MIGETSIDKRGETFFLNLRFILIVTVFASNAVEPLIGTMGGLHALYMWIFSFHMPLFVLVTGYFARKSLSGSAGRKILLQIGLQYVVFQSLYSLLDRTLFQVNGIHHSFFAPYLLLWFLASHAFWRLLMLGMNKWSPLGQMTFAILAGIFVGYLQLDGVWFSISRTFVYLPFFVAGYHFSFSAFERVYTKWIKIIAASASLFLFFILMKWGVSLPLGWLFGSFTYTQLEHQEWYAGLYRIGVYGLQFIAALAFLGWIPSQVSRLTDWGRRTLYVFLLHGFIVRLAVVSGIYDHLNNAGGALIVLTAAVSLTILLAQPIVKQWMHPIVEPSVSWMTSIQRAVLRRSL